MGSQTSKVLEKTRERTGNRPRRRSTATTGSRSKTASVTPSQTSSHANYEWIEQHPTVKGSAPFDSAVAAVSSVPPSDTLPPLPAEFRPVETPRRKSISEMLTRRKGSFLRTSLTQDDMREYDRLQRQHYLLKSARKANAWAPINHPKTILDVGTANGIWALEMAAQYPDAQVFGIDTTPPRMHSVPKNLKFMEFSIDETWPFADNSIDFIFQRSMGHQIRKDKWRHVLGEMQRILRPDGYIELLEPDLWHHNPGPVQQAFDAFMQEQCVEHGLDYAFTETLASQLEEMGYVDLEQRALDIPIGEWPQEPELQQFGFINKEIQKAYLRNRKQYYMTTAGISNEDFDLAVQEVLEEFEEYHGFTRFNCWIAKKPSV